MRRPFYLVWNPDTGYAKHKHPDKLCAELEAKRLTLANRGQEFIVLAPVSVSKIADVVTESFDYSSPDFEQDIPF
jgi:hypothetical protein